MRLLCRQLPPEHDPGLHDEEDAGDVLEDDADEGEPERPGEEVVLPLGHVVPAVAQGSEDDQGDGSEGTWYQEAVYRLAAPMIMIN